MEMPRFALKIEYLGRPFSGWQNQRGQLTVQQVVEDAVRELDPACIGVHGAGRTDAGVHALGQVAHCDLARDWDAFRLSEALNYHLRPHPVAILGAARVPDSFHARFSAIERCYVYRIVSRRSPLTIRRNRAWHIRHELDLEAMRQGAAQLLGLHDFTTFRSAACQARSPVRTLDELDVRLEQTNHQMEYVLVATAQSFLHRQVRSIVGTLERVGSGAWTPDQVGEALQARTGTRAGRLPRLTDCICPTSVIATNFLGDVRSSDCIEEPGAAGEI